MSVADWLWIMSGIFGSLSTSRLRRAAPICFRGVILGSNSFCRFSSYHVTNHSSDSSVNTMDGVRNGTNSLSSNRFFIETYGCQMNKVDSGVIQSLLLQKGFEMGSSLDDSRVIIMNTCSIREHAEARVLSRIEQYFNIASKKRKEKPIIVVAGCMASRLKDQLLGIGVSVVVGPDSYRRLPEYIREASSRSASYVNTQLLPTETYASIDSLNQFPLPCAQLTIMRGCNNMCNYCVVPFTRGRERSVSVDLIHTEVDRIEQLGYKEITLLGQNVNSYCDREAAPCGEYETTRDMMSVLNPHRMKGMLFPALLESIAKSHPEMRIRFTSPHPKDFPLSLLNVMKSYPNVCKNIHLPLQSGNNECLKRMNRPYTRESYLELVWRIRDMMPDCSISTDVITGFCGETEEEHKETLNLIEKVGFDEAYMYMFSMRENTYAWHHMVDDVPNETKHRRLFEIQSLYQSILKSRVESLTGKLRVVLVEGESKRSSKESVQLCGKDDQNHMCVMGCRTLFHNSSEYSNDAVLPSAPFELNGPLIRCGDYVVCKIVNPGTSTHQCIPLFHTKLSRDI